MPLSFANEALERRLELWKTEELEDLSLKEKQCKSH